MKVTKSRFEPFYLATRDDNKVIIVAGQNQVSPIEFNSEKEAEDYMKKQPFELMLNLVTIIMYYENQENQQTNKEGAKMVEKDA